MNEISNIHAFEDEDFLHACFVWGMVVVGVFAVCLVPVFMLLGGPADLDAADAGGWMAVVGWIVGLAAVSAASFAGHELVHGVFFKLLAPAGFGKFSVTTAEAHDRIIAFTSQLAHVVSNAYVKSPTAKEHRGFSAGSYKDLTRVAWLNEQMWSELFCENRDPLLFEIDHIIASLSEYRNALAANDKQALCNLLREGRIAKEEIDG